MSTKPEHPSLAQLAANSSGSSRIPSQPIRSAPDRGCHSDSQKGSILALYYTSATGSERGCADMIGWEGTCRTASGESSGFLLGAGAGRGGAGEGVIKKKQTQLAEKLNTITIIQGEVKGRSLCNDGESESCRRPFLLGAGKQ